MNIKKRLSFILNLIISYKAFFGKTPGDGFEPPLKEPESFVLPLDDPGIIITNYPKNVFS